MMQSSIAAVFLASTLIIPAAFAKDKTTSCNHIPLSDHNPQSFSVTAHPGFGTATLEGRLHISPRLSPTYRLEESGSGTKRTHQLVLIVDGKDASRSTSGQTVMNIHSEFTLPIGKDAVEISVEGTDQLILCPVPARTNNFN